MAGVPGSGARRPQRGAQGGRAQGHAGGGQPHVSWWGEEGIPRVGGSVHVLHEDGLWWPGKLTQCEGTKWRIDFEDGDQDTYTLPHRSLRAPCDPCRRARLAPHTLRREPLQLLLSSDYAMREHVPPRRVCPEGKCGNEPLRCAWDVCGMSGRSNTRLLVGVGRRRDVKVMRQRPASGDEWTNFLQKWNLPGILKIPQYSDSI
jgi:hypothetical protein